MTYQVLARKWRPKNFTEVASQAATINILQNSLSTQKLHHAYLFTGTRGVGKTTIARILAKALICEQGITKEPCNVCSFCHEVTLGNCLDVIEIDAASKTKVEDTRAILENLAYAPSAARFKIYIIDEVHMLSNHSFNALLKSLEEPPNHVKFLLATTEPNKLPITVLSRCLEFKLSLFTDQNIIKQLENILTKEQIIINPDALLQLAIAARGSMRDALSLLEKVLAFSENNNKIELTTVNAILGVPDWLQIIELLQAIVISDVTKIFTIINKFFNNNFDLALILQKMQLLLKNITVLQILSDANKINNIDQEVMNYQDLLLKLAENATKEEIQLYYDITIYGLKNIAFTPDTKVWFEMLMLRMVAFLPSDIKPDMDNINNIIEQLNLTGLTKELAEQAVFKLTDNKLELIIDNNKKCLLTSNNIEKLQTKISEYLAKDITINIKYQDFEQNKELSLATIRFKKSLELQNFIKKDKNLNQVIDAFDGQVEMEVK